MEQGYLDWRLSFADDGSKILGEPIVKDVLRDHLDKIRFLQTGMTFEDKIDQGLILGSLANQEIARSDAEIAIMLCDDDELHPHYFKNLSEYFAKNPQILYCYSKIHLFNPLLQKSSGSNNLHHKYNRWNEPIEPAGKVDASQVAWRLACCKQHGARFSESTKFVSEKPWTKDTDKSFFESICEKCGLCHPTEFIAQYKGVHDYQLLWHKNTDKDGLRAYDDMIRELSGMRF